MVGHRVLGTTWWDVGLPYSAREHARDMPTTMCDTRDGVMQEVCQGGDVGKGRIR